MSNSKMKGFLVYYDNEVIVCRLTDAEAGKLFKSLFPYAKERIRPTDFEGSPALAMAFDVLSMAIDQNKEWYDQKCKTNRANIAKRWNTNVYDGIPNDTNVYDGIPNDTNVYDRIPNKDKYKNKDKDKNKINNNYQLIADMYNDTCVSFPRLTKLSEKRKKAIQARLKTYTVDDFKKLFEIAEGSSFLKGQNSRNWSATFDWLITDGNMAKVLDGNYSERKELPAPEEYHGVDPEFSEIVRNYKDSPDDPFQ